MRKIKLPEKILHTIAFLVLGCALIPAVISDIGIGSPLVKQVFLLAFYITLLASLIRVANNAASSLLLNVVRLITAIIFIGLSIFLVGAIQDIMRVRCQGFMGAQSTCVSSAIFTLNAIMYLGIYIPLTALFVLLMAAGIAVSSTQEKAPQKSKKSPKRDYLKPLK